jgi:hypothetical protein
MPFDLGQTPRQGLGLRDAAGEQPAIPIVEMLGQFLDDVVHGGRV